MAHELGEVLIYDLGAVEVELPCATRTWKWFDGTIHGSVHIRLLRALGVEPKTCGLKGRCSTTELRPRPIQQCASIARLPVSWQNRLT